jgi:hypothetical protein
MTCPEDVKVVVTGDQLAPLSVERHANGVKLDVATMVVAVDATRFQLPEDAVVTSVQVMASVEVSDTPVLPTATQRVPSWMT